MKPPRSEAPRAQPALHGVPDNALNGDKIDLEALRWWDRWSHNTRDRATSRFERDHARGYSINVKQVLLAFAVEFVIIGLILTGQFIFAAQLPNASQLVIA